MAATVDLDQLARLFSRRGERVVLVLPSGEVVVLVPLTEYEQLVPAVAKAPVPPRRSPGRPPTARAASPAPLEAIDPPQGQLPDDDEYFPEPLE